MVGYMVSLGIDANRHRVRLPVIFILSSQGQRDIVINNPSGFSFMAINNYRRQRNGRTTIIILAAQMAARWISTQKGTASTVFHSTI